MNKKANPDAPVFSMLQALMEQEGNESSCDVLIPDTLEGIAIAVVKHKGRMTEECWIIGKLLLAAKEKLTEHGEWLDWLAKNVDIPDWRAERYMKLAREFPNSTAPSILGLTKALEITKIPESDRGAFLQEPHFVDGQEKTVVQMTTRELEKAVQDWLEPKTEDADDYQVPPISVSNGTGKYDDDEDDFVRWDSASSERFAAELETMLTQLQKMRHYMVSKKGQGLPGKQCVEKLCVIHTNVLNCLSLAGIETVKLA